MAWEIVGGVLLAVVALALFPAAIRALWILLDLATLTALAYGTVIYARLRGYQLPSTGTWWIDLGLALSAGCGLLGLLTIPSHELYHRVRHGTWDLWARHEWWERTLPRPLCPQCAEDEQVDQAIMKALRRRLATLPLWARTLNEVIAMAKTLPSLLIHALPLGLLGLALMDRQFLPWGITAGVVYLLLAAWRAARWPHRTRVRLLRDLGLDRDALLGRKGERAVRSI